MKTVQQHWTEQVGDALVGRRIKAVFYETDEYWSDTGICLELDDGTEVIVSQDDEGNGPGVLFISRGDKVIHAPMIPKRFAKTLMETA
jgi:hypothetical protein